MDEEKKLNAENKDTDFDLKAMDQNADLGEPDQVNLDNEALKRLILKQNETINTLKAKYEALKEQNTEMALHSNFGNNEPDPDNFFKGVLGIN